MNNAVAFCLDSQFPSRMKILNTVHLGLFFRLCLDYGKISDIQDGIMCLSYL